MKNKTELPSGEKQEGDIMGLLQSLPCAVYIARNDADFTIEFGNEKFYNLFGCTAEEMNYKYGNRLGAVIDENSIKKFEAKLQQNPNGFGIKQKIQKQGKAAWIYTKACLLGDNIEQRIFCISCDITESEASTEVLYENEEKMRFAAQHLSLDTFEYDFATGGIKILQANTVLPRVMNSLKAEYADLVLALCEGGALSPQNAGIFCKTLKNTATKKQDCNFEICLKTTDDCEIWARIELYVKQKGRGAAAYAIGFIEDITRQKATYLSYITETQSYLAMLAESDAYMQIDVTEDKITKVGGFWEVYNDIILSQAFSAIAGQAAESMVHPEDKEKYLEFMQIANLLQSFENGISRLDCDFRRIVVQNKMSWLRLHITLFKNSLTGHTMALATIKNIDAEKNSSHFEWQARRQSEGLQPKEQATGAMAQQLFNELLDSDGDMAYIIDPETFELLAGNQSLYSRLGKTEAECHGMKCYELMHGRKSPCPFCSKSNWREDKFYIWKNYNYKLEQEYIIKNKLVQWNGKEAVLAIWVDISNDKCLTNSIGGDATESHCVLSGAQQMMAGKDLNSAMYSSLEAIGYFFNATSVQFWERIDADYKCAYEWTRQNSAIYLTEREKKNIDKWLKTVKWENSASMDSPEAMLCNSYEMYDLMKAHSVKNQRWFQIKDGKKELGCLTINNIGTNFANAGFLEAFTSFMAEEIKKRRLAQEILDVNQRDALTGLLSRTCYDGYVSRFNADCFASVGTVFANFDHLKEINDNKGFHTGNYCIREFSNMLKQIFVGDVVFRMNGDEFLAICTNESREELEEKVCALEELIKENGVFTVSIGHSWDNIEKDATKLLEQATEAMRINKKRHYDTIPAAVDAERRKMLNRIVSSINNREFEMYLQPKVSIKSGKMIGAEALVRFNHKTKGVVAPGHFIEILEANNLIRYVDLFIFEEVCRFLDKWNKAGKALPVVSLNFSRLTILERGILKSMEAIISQYNVPRKNIEIEITESVSSIGKSILYQAVDNLHSAGFSIALDDFGTKYTNLAILSDIDVDVLKLDRSLINSLTSQKSVRIILKNIVNMCRDLKITIIAEGIETEEQAEILSELKCKLGQGYLYGKPMTEAEFDKIYF